MPSGNEDITCLVEDREGARELIIAKGKEARNLLTWNYAGALVQTGDWRTFHSSKQAWMMLATFWGMKAPDLVPTCTTWQGLKDNGQPIRLTRIKRHLVYLKQYSDIRIKSHAQTLNSVAERLLECESSIQTMHSNYTLLMYKTTDSSNDLLERRLHATEEQSTSNNRNCRELADSRDLHEQEIQSLKKRIEELEMAVQVRDSNREKPSVQKSIAICKNTTIKTSETNCECRSSFYTSVQCTKRHEQDLRVSSRFVP